jgi:DNA-binding MarR family transcriptional regulator
MLPLTSSPTQNNAMRPATSQAHGRPMLPLYQMPGHLIRRAHQVSTALFAEECAAFGLTSVQYAALMALRANPGVDATRLSTLIAFDRSTIGDVLDRLETKGWVLRGPSPTDRRVKLLSLTAAGEAMLDQVADAVERVQQRLLEPLAPADREVIVRLLAQIVCMHNETAAPA